MIIDKMEIQPSCVLSVLHHVTISIIIVLTILEEIEVL